MQELSFEPLIPTTLWLTLAGAGVGVLGWYAWRRPIAVSRFRWGCIVLPTGASLALVLLVLSNPTWVEPVAPPSGKPSLLILVDASASMATADAADGQSRYESAGRLARACAADLAARYDVRTAIFAASLLPVDAAELQKRQPEGSITDLAAVLTESLVDNSGQGQVVILLSDGIHNAGGGSAGVLEAVKSARGLGTAIYTRTYGGDPQVRDLAVELRVAQEIAYVGQKVGISALLRQQGFSGRKVRLALFHQGKELERRSLQLGQEPAEAAFQAGQDQPGIYRYEVRAEPLPGEVSLANNNATLMLRVLDKPVRVLLVEGRPYWDGKFLVRTLLADPSIELDSLVRLGGNRLMLRTFRRLRDQPMQPTQEQWKIIADGAGLLTDPQLSSYQVVVLGRDADEFLTEPALQRLRNWIARDGGMLVCYRGQPTSQVNQRLGQLLPLRWTPAREARFRVSLTERGRELQWIPNQSQQPLGAALAQLPTLATSARPDQPKPLAVVLATGRGQGAAADDPVLAYQPYGTGRVVVIEGAGMWRWAFLPPAQQKLDDVYRLLWHGLFRWLVTSSDLLPGQKLVLRSDRVSFGTSEPATASLLVREEAKLKDPPNVELRGEGIEGSRSLAPVALGDEPGTYRIVFGKLPEGRYQIRLAGSDPADPATSSGFDVRNLFEEQLDLKARPDLMARIARESGGTVLEGSQPQDILARFHAHRELGRARKVERLTAWDRWWVLLAAFGLWGAAWSVRRGAGLV